MAQDGTIVSLSPSLRGRRQVAATRRACHLGSGGTGGLQSRKPLHSARPDSAAAAANAFCTAASAPCDSNRKETRKESISRCLLVRHVASLLSVASHRHASSSSSLAQVAGTTAAHGHHAGAPFACILTSLCLTWPLHSSFCLHLSVLTEGQLHGSLVWLQLTLYCRPCRPH